MVSEDPADLLRKACDGDRRAIARLLSLIERDVESAQSVARRAHPLTGNAYVVGITGAPGAGKSTLTGALVTELRRSGATVAVIAVDPSSPYSGGAILGDRLRMGDHVLDSGVFIRSMATRGHHGGLALATRQAIRLLDAVGFDWLLIETVGVGQVEVEIASTADSTLVVVNPGWGDAVQANKAGLMEVADIFVINKADRPGEGQTRRDLQGTLSLAEQRAWSVPIISTTATSGTGVAEVLAALVAHRSHLDTEGDLQKRRNQRLLDEMRLLVEHRVRLRAEAMLDTYGGERLEQEMIAGDLDPWSAADQVVAAFKT